MKTNELTEKESIELISKMIEKTRNEMNGEDFNLFLAYGYAAVATSIAVWLLTHFTGKSMWCFGWFAMFIPYILSFFKKEKPEVVTYMDRMMDSVWKVIGSMFGISLIIIIVAGSISGIIDFSMMMPLSIIYAGIGTSITGLIINEKWFVWTPLAGLAAAIWMITCGWAGGSYDNSWNLLFGASFLIYMVLPAHIVRHKIRRS